MAEYFFIINGWKVPVTALPATVVKVSKLSETVVRGDAYSTKSTVYHTTEFWVQYDNNNEDKFSNASSKIELREGHRVTLLFDNNGKIISVLNNSLKQVFHWVKDPAKYYNIYHKNNPGNWASLVFILGVAIPIVINIYYDDYQEKLSFISKSHAIWGAIILFGIILIPLLVKAAKISSANDDLEKQFENEIIKICNAELK